MSASLRDLLFTMRQHPGFPDLLKAFDAHVATVPSYSPRKKAGDDGAQDQYANWIYRSGQNAQQRSCRMFLTDFDPSNRGEVETSQQGKP